MVERDYPFKYMNSETDTIFCVKFYVEENNTRE